MTEFIASDNGFIKITQENGCIIINIDEISQVFKFPNSIEIRLKDSTILKQDTSGEEESEKIFNFFVCFFCFSFSPSFKDFS